MEKPIDKQGVFVVLHMLISESLHFRNKKKILAVENYKDPCARSQVSLSSIDL